MMVGGRCATPEYSERRNYSAKTALKEEMDELSLEPCSRKFGNGALVTRHYTGAVGTERVVAAGCCTMTLGKLRMSLSGAV